MCSFCEHARAPSLSAWRPGNSLCAGGSNSADPICAASPLAALFGLDRPLVCPQGCERFRACEATSRSPRTPWRALQPSCLAAGRSRSTRLRSPKTKQRHRGASHAVRTGSKSGEGEHRRILEAGGGEEKKRLDEILSGFVDRTCQSTKPDAAVLRGSDRMGRVRASVRGHGAQMRRARKGSAERSPTPSTARYDALHWRQARADALTPDASAWRAVEMICATARGSDVSLGLRGAVSMPASCTSRHRLCANTSSLDTSIDIRVR